MTDSLKSSRYSLEHAKRRMRELEQEIQAFCDSNPCALVLESEIGEAKDVLKLKLVKAIPEAIPGIMMDTLNALRASLDQAGHSVAVAAKTSGKKAYFPIGATLKDVVRLSQERSKHIPKPVLDVMIGLEPYKGGNVVHEPLV